jgi:hypothetical protein
MTECFACRFETAIVIRPSRLTRGGGARPLRAAMDCAWMKRSATLGHARRARSRAGAQSDQERRDFK